MTAKLFNKILTTTCFSFFLCACWAISILEIHNSHEISAPSTAPLRWPHALYTKSCRFLSAVSYHNKASASARFRNIAASAFSPRLCWFPVQSLIETDSTARMHRVDGEGLRYILLYAYVKSQLTGSFPGTFTLAKSDAWDMAESPHDHSMPLVVPIRKKRKKERMVYVRVKK